MRIAVLDARIRQLQATLDQMEKETQIQRSRIEAARGDLQVIAENLTVPNRSYSALDTTSTGALAGESAQEMGQAAPPADHKAVAKKQIEKRTFRLFLLTIFAVFAAIYIYKLWQQRQTGIEGDADEPGDEEPSGPVGDNTQDGKYHAYRPHKPVFPPQAPSQDVSGLPGTEGGAGAAPIVLPEPAKEPPVEQTSGETTQKPDSVSPASLPKTRRGRKSSHEPEAPPAASPDDPGAA